MGKKINQTCFVQAENGLAKIGKSKKVLDALSAHNNRLDVKHNKSSRQP